MSRQGTHLRISNWIQGRAIGPSSKAWFPKHNPHNGMILSYVPDSSAADVARAVESARKAFCFWREISAVQRGDILFRFVELMRENEKKLATCVAQETGKSPRDSLQEVQASIRQGQFFAGEGMRLHGRSLVSAVARKHSHTIRQPLGVAGLIVPANTPLANIAWKVFPALICGNTAVLKASEDAPATGNLFAEMGWRAGLPAGVLNVIHGRGSPAGSSLVENPEVDLISFTGSTQTGRWIAQTAGARLARVSLELGGKNPLVVCDDADLDHAVVWALSSAFSNAGQRCAAASRIFVFRKIYRAFCARLVRATERLKVGPQNGCDLGPVINSSSHRRILEAIAGAKKRGGKILTGGKPPKQPALRHGYYVEPTLVAGLPSHDVLNTDEIFGPVATLTEVADLEEAIRLANDCPYGLTAAIHTRSVDRAWEFVEHVRSGVANVNLGTHGSEPHMPFGGFGASGNGTREPGVEALDVYSELKTISFFRRGQIR